MFIKIKELRQKLPRWINFYTVTIFLFLIFITFISSKSLMNQWALHRQQKQYDKQTEIFEQEIRETDERYADMDKNDTTIERYAREKYYMHTADEQIYLIEEKE